MTQIIAFTGSAGAGKSMASSMLINKGFARVKFAGPLKAMLRGFLSEVGCPKDEIEAKIEGDLKEKPCQFLGGATPRFAMQTLGTEWGRDIMHKELWTLAFMYRVGIYLAEEVPVVVDDCRFENEAEVIRSLGGVIVRIDRPSLMLSVPEHVSEAGVKPDYTIKNDGTEDDLLFAIDDLMKELGA